MRRRFYTLKDRFLKLILMFVLLVPVTVSAAQGQIVIEGKSLTLKQIIREIEKKSEYSFFFKTVDFDKMAKQNVNCNGSIEEVLAAVFKNSNVKYVVKGKEIILKTEETKAESVPTVQQNNQKATITGVVKDAMTGDPIIGASVVAKGESGNGTITDLDGKFMLTINPGAELAVSYIGYTSSTVATKPGTTQYTIALREDNQMLSEVVVVGYNTQKKESLTGALQSVKGDKLKDVTTPSVENMLNGKVAGVYVAPGSGQPGAAGAVVIRGQATLSGTTAPLWVVDGVIVGTGPGQLNPSDIETMTVLKDAASTAIYGSEGANGVIVVTTKNGKIDKMNVNISAKLGVSSLNNGNLKMMNGAELYDYYSSFSNAASISFPRWNENLRNDNFDWWKLATETGFTQEYNVSVQGGSEKLNSYFSFGVYDEKGSVKGYDYSRYNFLLKSTYKPYKWLTVKPLVSGSRRNISDTQYSVTSMYSMFPWDSPYDADGGLVSHRYSGWVNNTATNYLLDLSYGNKGSSRNLEFMGNLDADLKFTDWLTLSLVNSYKYISYGSESYTDPRSSGGQSVKGRVGDYRYEVARRFTNQILHFNKTFGQHSVQALMAHEFKDYWSKILDVLGTGMNSGFEVLDATALAEKAKGGISEWAVQSFFFKGIYSYDSRYMAELSLRRDGASNFGVNNKWGNFFAVSAGWNISREKWFDVKAIDNLKLRASYGANGNRPSSLYPQYDLYSVASSYSYSGVPGALISQIGNKDLTWEQTKTFDLGLDLMAWENRLRVNFDWYVKNTDNILYSVPVSGLTGVTRLWKNIGQMKNTGIELSIGGDIIRTKDWTWSVDANIGHNKNELKQLYQTRAADGTYSNAKLIVGDGLNIAGTAQRLLEVGSPVDTYYMPEWAGVNPENGAPQWYVLKKDENGVETRSLTSKYAEASYFKCGTSNPNVFGGFNTAVNWKNVDFSAVFGYAFGGHIYNYSRQEYDSDGTYTDRNQMKLQKGWSRWTKPGDVATHPVAAYNNTSNANKSSSRYLEKSDYLKLRSLSIGYNLKLPQYFIQNMRLYFTGENLFTITDYSGVDPELPANDGAVMGAAGPSVYPSTRKFMFGINLTF